MVTECRAEEEGCVGTGESWDLGWGRWGHWECPSLTETNLGKQSVGKVVSSVLVLLHLRSRKTWRYVAAPWMSALILEEVPAVPAGEELDGSGRVCRLGREERPCRSAAERHQGLRTAHEAARSQGG